MNDIQDVMDALTFAESDPVIWVAAGTYLGNDGSELQMEMTAYPNGTATVGTLPMYGGYADYYTRSQYVIPAAEIAQLAGYPIYSLTYYTTSNPSQWTSDFQVYLTEVSNSTMSSLIDPTTATTVYTGKLSVANGEMTVIFDTPYHYNGGNLLIGMDCLSSNGNYSVCSFKAVSKSNAGMYAYNNTEATFSYSYAVNYVPTTTFNGEIVLYTMKEGLDVYGGFEGNEPADYDLSLRDFEANQTVLDGQLEHRVLYQPSDFTTQTIWDGFTLANGRAEDGNGGGALLKANSKLQNCVFENCQAYNGGAVYADGSEFENCIFRNDTATNDGGAVYLDYGDGGRFVNCLFAYNQAKRGGAICYYNQSYTESSPEFINCDIVNNSVTSDGYGGGIYNQTYGSNAIYTNCIVWGNKRNSYSNQIDGSGVAFSYCAVQGGWSGTGNINLAAANDGTSTSYKYVRFVNPENGDFRLKETSACVNMGKPDFTPSCLVDLEGNPRIYGDRIDIGCYEFSLSDGFHFLGMTNANWNLAANWLNSSMPSADDEAFIDANCVVNEDVDILKLTVSNGKSLSVPAGSTLTAGTLVTTAPAQLIIEDGGQLLNENNDVKGTVKKNINGYGTSEDGWYMIASPVTDNTNVTNLTFNTYNLFTFDGSEVLEWRTQHDNPAISHKTGYLYGNQEGTTLEFKGTLAGTTDATVLTLADGGEGMEFPGFNMIGNPYPCNAYITDSYLRTNALGNGFLPGTGAIAPCESVFVDAANDGQTVTFSKTPTRISFVSLTVAKNRGIADDRVIVRFDDSRNLEKFMFNESNTKLFIPQNDKEFAVVSAAENSKQDEVTEIPVSFKASEKGTYTISFDMEDVSAEYIHLIDNLTGADVDLLAAYANLKNSASYTFEAKPSDYASRFKLVFKVSNDDSTDSTSWFAYLSNGNLVIENIEGQATMQIIDVLGRVLNTEIVSGSYNKAHGLRAGLYIISLNGKTQKIVVE
ncbi:MAG: hypothetical protein KBT57_02820, partial [bacterium]|nr:hypothetical protein [Candidatus Limimorpha equi]